MKKMMCWAMAALGSWVNNIPRTAIMFFVVVVLNFLVSVFLASLSLSNETSFNDKLFLPFNRVNNNNIMSVDLKGFCNIINTTTVSPNTFVTIFIMTRDRISSLKETYESYQQTITLPYEIVILDHDSTYPEMVQYLRTLETDQNITVLQLKQKQWGPALEEADKIMHDYLDRHPHIDFFAFTDPDIAFLRTAPDVLLFYAGLLHSCPNITCVGPGLQISDIPSYYSTTVFGGQSVFVRHSQL